MSFTIKEPLCINCKYYKKKLFSKDTFCMNPDVSIYDYCVETGKIAYSYAKSARLDETECGWSGKYYEQK